jgi:hypothetical protein
MPANVKPGRIVSLAQIINDYAPSIDLPRLADELHADIAVLLPIIDAAEMLGLVGRQKGKLTLTDFGLKFHRTIRNSDKIHLLKDNLTKIEPFKTSLRLTNQKRTVTAADIAESLRKNGVQWDHDPELNESLVNNLLIPWAILAGILSYDGKTQKFSTMPEKYI